MNWLLPLAIIYLILPFFIFCLTYLKIWFGLPIAILLFFVAYRTARNGKGQPEIIRFPRKDTTLGLITILVWVLLSGIGGLMFQNSDQHIRNAIFHDLINFDWPVFYRTAASTQSMYALIYYIGYWLPPALVGKILGWQAANIALFSWTCLGVFLVVILIKQNLKISLSAATLLLILFSGMDFLAVLVLQTTIGMDYPTILPPVTHLEWWARAYQYSSFTTQLFWVFNQAIPAWICIALLLFTQNHRQAFLILALCFFFAPLPALGLFPFTLLCMPNRVFDSEQILIEHTNRHLDSFVSDFAKDILAMVNFENCMGALILAISLLYYSANPNSSQVSWLGFNLGGFVLYLFFIMTEGFFLWLLIFKEQRRNLWWYAAGILLVFSPLVRFGSSIDFSMRVSIPALFVLMIFIGESMKRKPAPKYRILMIVLLAIGALTPLYEINRSIYRTVGYYLNSSSAPASQPLSNPSQPLDLPEKDHPETLTADFYPSLSIFTPDQITNFLGKTDHSFFFQMLANPPQP